MKVQQHIHLQDNRRYFLTASQGFLGLKVVLRTVLIEYNIQHTNSRILFILIFAKPFSREESIWENVF